MTAPTTPPTAPPTRTRTRTRGASSEPAAPAGPVSFKKTDPAKKIGHRVMPYGPGGTGKTSLALMAPGPVAIFDLENSLARLRPQLPDGLDVREIDTPHEWGAILGALGGDGWEGVGTIVIDSATILEELATQWVIANVPHEKPENQINRITDYGFGKGGDHVYDCFLKLFAALDRHADAGRHVVLIAHDCTNSVPNPQGEDFIRFEPRLQAPKSGKSSVRLRAREWADHLIFIGYDITTSDGKGVGAGTRSIWPFELPHAMAKSRSLDEVVPYQKHDAAIWQKLIG